MIAHLQGNLIRKSPESLIIDVNGVGYRVFVSLPTYYGLPGVGSRVSLKIHAHIREDDFRLFGFSTEEEQTVFEKLIGISKVGPKLALTILSGMSVPDLKSAIMNKDIVRLSSIPGVGPKTAERLALELKDKLQDVAEAAAPAGALTAEDGIMNDALSAMINLGYKKPQVEKILKSVYADCGENPTLEHLIKKCLKSLS